MSTTPLTDNNCDNLQPPSQEVQQRLNKAESTAHKKTARKPYDKRTSNHLPDETKLFEEWKNRKRIKDLAKKYRVSYTVIRKILIAHDETAYREIARIRRARRNAKKLSVTNLKLYEQWKNGMSTKALAEKYKVSRQTIVRRLKEFNEKEYRELAQTKVAASIANRRKVISVPPDDVLEQWLRGASTVTLAEKYHVSRQTIGRLLARLIEKDYRSIAKQRILKGKTKDLQVPISEVFDKWEGGETPQDLEQLCGISYRQLLEKMKAYDPIRYQQVAERRGLGSVRAKRYGARSLFELRVRRILEEYGFDAKESILKLGKHNWRPDVLLTNCRIIIEAMGLNFSWYWVRNKTKIEDYLQHGYRVIAVVPSGQIYRTAIKHLCKKVLVLRYREFENFVATSLTKVADIEHFSLTKR